MKKKKLIEVALPLEAINAAAPREKSIRYGHPSTLHLWWARRPLAAARAVIWASLVDDPSSRADLFPTEEAQNAERERLFKILEKLVVWENSNSPEVLAEARAEIMKSTGGAPPALLDPFAGGGAIPLEAARLGLSVRAHDLNPVAVVINKAMIEIPALFAGLPPVNPQANLMGRAVGEGTSGLAEDVRYYGERMKREAYKRIGSLYPKVKVPKEQGGGEADVIAWIWVRTVKCPNPACRCEAPLANSFELSKKKNKRAWIEPEYDAKLKKITYVVRNGEGTPPPPPKVSRGKFRCVVCGSPISRDYIAGEFQNHRNGARLAAIVAEGKTGRLYLSPDEEQAQAANVPAPDNCPEQEMNEKTTDLVSGRGYGVKYWRELFTPRQLTALATFSSLADEARAKAQEDAAAAGLPDDGVPLAEGGGGAKAYGEAIGVYLALAVDKAANIWSSFCSWMNDRGAFRETFSRQAIPMVWDYAEGNPFCNSSGCFDNILERVCRCVANFPTGSEGRAQQFDAQSDCGARNVMVATDPPYYDNIAYADLSDFFYIWLRENLKETFPELFRTMLAPKAEELIAAPYRRGGSAERAKDFFEDGMLSAFKQIYKYVSDDAPVTVFYAYKQSESDAEGTASTGWETMLSSVIRAGFAVTGTWPMRTESPGRIVARDTNALASSVVLVLRKRASDAPTVTRRDFINELKRELRPALRKLQSGNVAPVDLAQCAIGPGMAVFSKYKEVSDAAGKAVTVRSALRTINRELDLYFNEQDGELGRDSGFCVALYAQYAFNEVKFGAADVLARAKNTSVDSLCRQGALLARKGTVRLLGRDEQKRREPAGDEIVWLLTQRLTRAMEEGGTEACAAIVAALFSSTEAERAKALAYRLHAIAERKGWSREAFAYNALVTAWPDIQRRAAEASEKKKKPKQAALFGKEE